MDIKFSVKVQIDLITSEKTDSEFLTGLDCTRCIAK